MMSLVLFIVIPLAAAFLIALLGRHIKNIGDVVTNLVGLGLFSLSIFAAMEVLSGKSIIYHLGGWPGPLGISLVADGFTALMLVAVNLVGCAVLVYSLGYMVTYTDKWNFQALFMLMLAGLNGALLSSDIFNLYIFLELVSIAAYVLVAFSTEAESMEASFRYVIMGSLASAFILLGIAAIYSYTSTLSFAGIAASLAEKPDWLLMRFVLVLFIAGFGLKAAVVPFHAWLADAHSSAPSPVSAMLSAVVIKTLGVYALVRIIFNVLGVSDAVLSVFMVLGIFSMVAGAFLAISQNDIKRMFAYSSVSQIGYIIFAFGIGTPLAIAGGLLHLFNHAVLKSLLFLSAGSIEYATRKRDLNSLGGLKDKLPVTWGNSLVGSLGVSGIPPLGGFWSKLVIIIAAIETGRIAFSLIAVLVSIVTLAYYMKFQGQVFFGKMSEAYDRVKEASFTMKLAMSVLALVSVFSGLLLIPSLRPFLGMAVNSLWPAVSQGTMVSGALR